MEGNGSIFLRTSSSDESRKEVAPNVMAVSVEVVYLFGHRRGGYVQ